MKNAGSTITHSHTFSKSIFQKLDKENIRVYVNIHCSTGKIRYSVSLFTFPMYRLGVCSIGQERNGS